MQFTQEQYKTAQKVELVEYLKSQGYLLIKDGHAYRLREHDSLVIRGNMWYWFSRGFGGTTLQFLTQYEKRSLTEAVNILANGYTASSIYSGFSDMENEITKDFQLPEKNNTCRRVFAYLNQARGIDGDIIKRLINEGNIYESKIYSNCVFVGSDKNGIPRYASMRGTYILEGKKPFRKDIDGSDKSYGFCMNGSSNLVYAFESPIDTLSHATLFKQNGLEWRRDFRLSLGGVSCKALERFLSDNLQITRITFCLDNDETGRNYSKKLAAEYNAKGYSVDIQLPRTKDYNDELLYFNNMQVCTMSCCENEL